MRPSPPAHPGAGIVENMSSFVCGSCGHESHPFGSGGVDRAAANLDMEVLGKVCVCLCVYVGDPGGNWWWRGGRICSPGCVPCGCCPDGVMRHGSGLLTTGPSLATNPRQIPLNISIRETSDEGAPIVASQPDSGAAAAYVSVAERVWAKLQQQAGAAARPGPDRV